MTCRLWLAGDVGEPESHDSVTGASAATGCRRVPPHALGLEAVTWAG
jgi:hypothetical protein